MNRLLSAILFFALTFTCQAQSNFNLDFETQPNAADLPTGWFKWGQYTLSADSISHTGLNSGKITSGADGSTFGSIAYRIDAAFRGDSITLDGYMKIRDVSDGHAGLLLRLNGGGTMLGFDNMQDHGITGTHDWKKYSITLPYDDDTEFIFVAGILVGTGEAWFDDFSVSIDGEDLQEKAQIEKPNLSADLDTEFWTGSGITFGNLNNNEIRNLDILGKVWGFLKYYHPAIGRGEYNWDYELFRFLPQYNQTTGTTARNAMLMQWIDDLGPVEKCKTCETTAEDAFLKPDLKWVSESGLGEELEEMLFYIRDNRHQGDHYYIGAMRGSGNPDFKNENAYDNMTFPDDGFRLLSAYRYWNMINYFFPYKHLIDKDWNEVLAEYIPMFLNAQDELEYELAAVQLIGEIHDTHANLWGGNDKMRLWKGMNFPSFKTDFVEGKLIVTDYYNPELQTGLKVGDIITSINSKPVEEIVKEVSKYYPASNNAARLRDIGPDMLRTGDTDMYINVTFLDASGEKHNTSVPVYSRDSLNIYRWYRRDDEKCYKLLDGNIGYITLKSIHNDDIPKIKDEFQDTHGIIIDIRNYPSTFVPFELGSYFISSKTPFAQFTRPNVDNPGEFNMTDGTKIPPDGNRYRGKLVVLVNELSQSQAEYTAMAFRAGDNTTIVGSTTAGADGNVSVIYLPGGLRTMISGIGVYYPDGTETQRVGIVPDVEVRPTIKGIRQGRDEVLEAGI